MTNERKGQVAILYLKHKLRKEGIRLTPDIRRQVGDTAKATGIPFEEGMEFAEWLVREMVDDVFGPEVPESKA